MVSWSSILYNEANTNCHEEETVEHSTCRNMSLSSGLLIPYITGYYILSDFIGFEIIVVG